jgi:hypothetical protein
VCCQFGHARRSSLHSGAKGDQGKANKLLFDGFSLYDAHPPLYILSNTVIIISSLDSDLQLFNFLYSYFYNVYFSIIVLKLGLKLLEKVKQSKYYKCYQGISYAAFTIYQMLILTALIYSSLTSTKACLGK